MKKSGNTENCLPYNRNKYLKIHQIWLRNSVLKSGWTRGHYLPHSSPGNPSETTELEPLKEEPSLLSPSSAAGLPLKALLRGHWGFLPPLFRAQGTIRKGSKIKANHTKKNQGNSNHPNSQPGAKLPAMWPSVSAAWEGLGPHSGSSPPEHLWIAGSTDQELGPWVSGAGSGLKSQRCHLWASQPRGNYCTSLSHCSLINEKRIKVNYLTEVSWQLHGLQYLAEPGNEQAEDTGSLSEWIHFSLKPSTCRSSRHHWSFLSSLKVQKLLGHSPRHHKNHEILLPRVHFW